MEAEETGERRSIKRWRGIRAWRVARVKQVLQVSTSFGKQVHRPECYAALCNLSGPLCGSDEGEEQQYSTCSVERSAGREGAMVERRRGGSDRW